MDLESWIKSKSNHIASKLERMILKNNNLKKLPPKIGQVGRQLEFLDVSNNQLRKMPKSIYTLRGEVIQLNLGRLVSLMCYALLEKLRQVFKLML